MIGDYIPLAFKSLSNNEKKYLGLLNNGIDDLLQYSIKSLKSSSVQSILTIRDEDDFKDEFRKIKLYSDLNELMIVNSKKALPPLRTFYKIGSELGYKSINKSKKLNEYDEEAISILSDYVFELVNNLNKSVGIGIRNTLYKNIVEKNSINDIALDLLNVPQLVVDRFKINTHTEMIATTEYSRAINTGTLQSFSNQGVQDVNIITTGLPNVCDVCIEIENNNPYTLEEAMRILPVHPHCACSVLSANSLYSNFTGTPVIIDLT